jgi:serine/threonine protein kinase
VAIKLIHAPSPSEAEYEKQRASLQAEIKALKRLVHPNIPVLYDYDLEAERPYLVMEYIGGVTYDRLIVSQEMLHIPVEERLRALEGIAKAVVAAHQRGLIHRDIKPGNISGIEKPYLLDFGIALEARHTSRTGTEIGTGIYMAPDGPPDVLNDNYSFAIVAYEVLFGRHPLFTAETIGKTVSETRERAAAILRERAWRLPSRLPVAELPGDLYGADMGRLEAIFERAFGSREGRYSDLTRLVADLREAVVTAENQPYLNQPAPPLSQGRPIPGEATYTADEVAKARQATDHGKPRQRRTAREWSALACSVVLVVWFVLLGLTVLLYRG